MNNILILLDGATDAELNNRGIKKELLLWTADANITHSDLIKSIHNECICAGADIITTNTFRSASCVYKRAGYTDKESKIRAKRSPYYAVKCAQNASKGIVQIAYSITTLLDDCYNPESFPGCKIALDAYSQTLDWLINAGVDILSLAKQYSVQTFLFNCNDVLKTILFIKDIHHFWDWTWGLYPNLCVEDYSNDYFNILNNDKFILGIENILKMNPDVIGFCCGSSPMHIKILKNQIIKEYQNAFENKT